MQTSGFKICTTHLQVFRWIVGVLGGIKLLKHGLQKVVMGHVNVEWFSKFGFVHLDNRALGRISGLTIAYRSVEWFCITYARFQG